MAEESYTYPNVTEFHFAADDDIPAIGLRLVNEHGETQCFSMKPKMASDVVAGFLHTASEQYQRRGDSLREHAPENLIPIQADYLKVRAGRTAEEVLISFCIGATRLLIGMDVNQLVGLCQWLSKQVYSEDFPDKFRH